RPRAPAGRSGRDDPRPLRPARRAGRSGGGARRAADSRGHLRENSGVYRQGAKTPRRAPRGLWPSRAFLKTKLDVVTPKGVASGLWPWRSPWRLGVLAVNSVHGLASDNSSPLVAGPSRLPAGTR